MIKVNNKPISINRFNDLTLNIKSPETDERIIILTWHYENDSEFFPLACLTRKFQSLERDVILYLPYVPNARMDRVENDEDIFTLKYFCELINNLHFKSVYVLDVHSTVSAGLLDNCILLKSDDYLNQAIQTIYELENDTDHKNLYMFYPDEGAMKRYQKWTNLHFGFGIKNRDWNTREIVGYDLYGLTEQDIKGKNFLIQDDICATGGTIYQAAKRLKEMGANHIYVFATHTENCTIFDGKLGECRESLLETGLIEKMFTTNSVFDKDDNFLNEENLIAEKMEIYDVTLKWKFAI